MTDTTVSTVNEIYDLAHATANEPRRLPAGAGIALGVGVGAACWGLIIAAIFF